MGLVGRCQDFGLHSNSVGKQESDTVQFTVFVVSVDIITKGCGWKVASTPWEAKWRQLEKMRGELWPVLSMDAKIGGL